MKTRKRLWQRIRLLALLIIMTGLLYVALLMIISHGHYQARLPGSDVSLRKFPYPYRSALTISSDIDETSTLKEFLTIQEFLITENETEFGRGLSLDIGNSFYGYREENEFAFKREYIEKEVIIEFIKSGYIDVIHSFNNATRKEILPIVSELSKRGCNLDVWVNHGGIRRGSKTNLGYPYTALGDNASLGHFHTDVSKKSLGFNFIWIWEVSSIVGQGVPVNPVTFFSGFNKQYPFHSLFNNCLKEFVKFCIAPFCKKYRGRIYNDLIWPYKLDDGQMVFEFMRNNTHPKGIDATSESLAECLSEDVLRSLIKNESYKIIYAHLGKNKDDCYLPAKTVESLKRLKKAFDDNHIYVSTTKKILNYYANHKYLNYHIDHNNGMENIIIDSISDPVRGEFTPSVKALRGITFYVDDPQKVNVYIKDRLITDVNRNKADFSGRKSIMIRLMRLPRMENKFMKYRESGLLS